MFTFILLAVLVVIFLIILVKTCKYFEDKIEEAKGISYTNGRKDCGDEWTIEHEALKTKKNEEITDLREFKDKEIKKLKADYETADKGYRGELDIKTSQIANQRNTITGHLETITKLATCLQHPFALFVLNRTIRKEGAEISAEELKAVYEKYTGKTITAIRMGQFLHFMQFTSKEKKGRSYWQGIAFVTGVADGTV